MTRPFARLRFALAVGTAFIGGLVTTAAFDFTHLGYAQQRGATGPVPTRQEVQPLAELSAAFVAIAENVTPAVVSINTERDGRRRAGGGTLPRNYRLPPGWEDFFRQFEDGDGRNAPAQASGSGFIVSKDGYIMTNNHVVADADRVEVRLMDGRTFMARIVGRDPTTDVAVIKIEGTNLPMVRLGEDSTAQIGEWVVAIGNPLGLDFTVTAGIVSAKGRSVRGLLPSQYAISDYIQTDAAINPGNSGGPLVNVRGEVIGVNSAIASQTGFFSGYGFAIPVSLAREVMDDLIAHGRVRRPVIGVSISEVTSNNARAAGLTDVAGVLVGGFSDDDSPAKRAGLQEGDVIVKVDGRPVDRVSTLQRIVRAHEPGESVALEVMRFGERKNFRVRLVEAPTEEKVAAGDETPARPESPRPTFDKLGISVQPLPSELARRANLGDGQSGVLVTDVDPRGPAHNQLVEGNVLLEILNPGPRRRIETVADVERVLGRASSGYVTFLVYDVRLRQTNVVSVRVGS